MLIADQSLRVSCTKFSLYTYEIHAPHSSNTVSITHRLTEPINPELKKLRNLTWLQTGYNVAKTSKFSKF